MLVPVAPGGHPTACGPHRYPLVVCVPGNHFAGGLRLCHNRHSGDNCRFEGGYCRVSSRPLSYIRHPCGNLLSVSSRTRNGGPHRVCSPRHDNNPLPSRGCPLCSDRGVAVAPCR